MFGFKEVAALASAIGLIVFQPGTTLGFADPHELRATEFAFKSTFKGVDSDGETLVWSSDAPTTAPGFVIRIVPMGSAQSSAESVWAVRATMTSRDSAGTPMESKLYGIIDWSRHELRLHGNCDSGTKSGSSVTALGTFTDFDVAGTVDVLPLTASR
ncbi:MAG TPA: hypothetical protein VGO46_13810 [Gemmatimonadaceae bacterium]|nr:hypothetical protein [Gemmatimonadaceae bacterium]